VWGGGGGLACALQPPSLVSSCSYAGAYETQLLRCTRNELGSIIAVNMAQKREIFVTGH
jgi:hypothetical protein